MRIFLWAATFVMIGTSPAQTQDSQPITAGKSQMANVAEEVRLIEEDSLPMDPSLQATNRPTNDPTSSKDRKDSDDPSRAKERSRAARAMAAYSGDASAKDNGIKLYRFTLAPKETLTTQVSSDVADVVTQRFGLLSGPNFTPSAASKSQINRINRLSRQQRTTRIDFKNTEERPFPLLLIVYGVVGHPYKIQISRDVAK
jgi:3-oxoacyl-(acyl-carrier-protein) synthase